MIAIRVVNKLRPHNVASDYIVLLKDILLSSMLAMTVFYGRSLRSDNVTADRSNASLSNLRRMKADLWLPLVAVKRMHLYVIQTLHLNVCTLSRRQLPEYAHAEFIYT
jgi:hypothetical protein